MIFECRTLKNPATVSKGNEFRYSLFLRILFVLPLSEDYIAFNVRLPLSFDNNDMRL